MARLKRSFAAVTAMVLILAVMAACSKSNHSAPASNATDTSSSSSAADMDTTASAPASTQSENLDDLYYGNYDPPITVTLVARTAQGGKYKDGDSFENNTWTRELKKHGILLKWLWKEDASQFESKMNVAISTSELPDLITQVTAAQANTLIKGDQLMDMKPYLDKYLSPLARKMLYADPDMMNGLMRDGKQLLLPSGAAEIRRDLKALWIRKDWLDKVGLPIPKTLEDFRKVSDAFTHQDPDGNNKDDTYGFGIAGKDNLILDWGGLSGFFEMFKVQPGPWWDGSLFYEKDGSGNIIWSGSKPAMKDALATLADMYNKGELAKDFGTIDAGGKLQQDIVGSKVGMFSGMPWMEDWPLPDLKSKVPTADWVVVDFPSADGTPTKPYGYIPGNVYKAVSKNAKHPEAIVQFINLYVEKVYGETADPAQFNSFDPEDTGKSHWNAPFILDDLYKDSKDYAAVRNALTTKDPSKLNTEQKLYYDDVLKYEQDPTYVKGWSAYQKFSGVENTSWWHYYEHIQESDVLKNAWFAFPTADMAAKSATYKKMASETITKIIYGQAGLDAWDKTVESWNKLGGDEILKQVQAQVK